MAEITPPLFTDTNSVFSGDELGLPYRDIMGEGVVEAGDLLVSAPGGLAVSVAAGACWIKGDDNLAAQPTYRCRSDSAVSLSITPNGSNPLIVRVVAEVIDQTFAGSGRLWRLRAIHGTPAASPVAPALPNNAITLATVAVAAGAGSIVGGNITDARTRSRVGGGLSLGGDQYGTVLPTTGLFNGYSFTLFVTNPSGGVEGFNLIYRADLDATYPWHYLGGGPIRRALGTSSAGGGSGVWVDIGDVWTFENAGVWEIGLGGKGNGSGSATTSHTAVGVNTQSIALDWDHVGSEQIFTIARLTVADNDVLDWYHMDDDSIRPQSMTGTYITVRPVRIAG